MMKPSVSQKRDKRSGSFINELCRWVSARSRACYVVPEIWAAAIPVGAAASHFAPCKANQYIQAAMSVLFMSRGSDNAYKQRTAV